MRTFAPCVTLLTVAACSTPLPERGVAEPPPPGVSWSIEPGGDPQNALAVSRLRVEGSTIAAGELWLFRGELSDYYLRRIRERDLPKTLLERAVPALGWAQDGSAYLAPSTPLEIGESYSFAAPDPGLIGRISVGRAAPLLERWFPKYPSFGGFAVYCGAAGEAGIESRAGWLEPGQLPFWLLAGVDGLRVGECWRLESDVAGRTGELLAPPLAGEDLAIDPEPLAVVVPVSIPSSTCDSGQTIWGPGCATVEDDRIVVSAPDAPLLWTIGGELPSMLRPTEPRERFVIGGLSAETPYVAQITTHSRSGEVLDAQSPFVTGAARERVVINEVMANPLGPEPASEWVELVNDGLIAVELGGWVLSDSGGESVLPAFSLSPGAFLLVAREDFAPGPGDVPPAEGITILRVPALGKNGLSNAGEPLELWRADGSRASAFPPFLEPDPGVSVARVVPWALDDDPASFALHGPPGASPGRANTF